MITSFSASVVSGSGRGKDLGTPTINLDPASLAAIGREGIYAAWAIVDGVRMPAVMHAGPRPVFNDTPSVEVHLLCPPPETIPSALTVELVSFIREVRDFASVEELQREIQRDVASARATLGLDVAYAQKGNS